MKYWMFILLFTAINANASLIKFQSSEILYGVTPDLEDISIGEYNLRITYNTDTRSYQDGYFTSSILSGPASANISAFGPWDEYMAAHNLSGSGIQIASGGGTYSLSFWEAWTFLPAHEDPSGRLDKTIFYADLDDIGGYTQIRIYGATFQQVPPTAADVPEPTTLALLGLGLAGLVSRSGLRLTRRQDNHDLV